MVSDSTTRLVSHEGLNSEEVTATVFQVYSIMQLLHGKSRWLKRQVSHEQWSKSRWLLHHVHRIVHGFKINSNRFCNAISFQARSLQLVCK